MGTSQSKRNNITAERLWVVENAKKGIKAVGTTLVSPFVVIACPIIGAYEYAYKEELGTGSLVVDGTLGFLFGVIASPLAPFFFMWERMEVLFGHPPPASPPTNEYLHEARQKMGLDSVTYYNVAIAGCPGTGKSTLVNGLLGYTDDHISAAQVHEANSCVEKSRGYKHPLLPSVMLWDLPGVTTSAKQYFHEHCLGAFDALLIVFADRLMASDIKLARKALEYDIPVFFVRNKADTVSRFLFCLERQQC
ncbi:P-loop containing nucleoside triphosphate hydrolase protein [Fennellomyces sp. T-0311]|nr:P-loop containing nucleoside triphosphate hydrolase protein [Fennellomyces sp. T-0311]